MAEESIFTKIIKGEIPSHKIYEDELTYAFMDINPIQPGHVLVITKKQVETFEQLENEDYMALMTTVKKVAEKIREVYNPPRVGMLIEGFEVPHVHVKLVPIHNEVELRRIPDQHHEPDHEALAKEAAKLQID